MLRFLAPALGEEDDDGEGGGEGGAGEVDAVVAEASGALESGSEEAVEDSSAEGRGEDGPIKLGEQEIGPLAGGADEGDGAEGKERAGEGDCAILARPDAAPGGDEAWAAAEDLSEFAAYGVSGGFGERGRGCGEENITCVAGEDERSGADGCGSDVGEYLEGRAAKAALGGAFGDTEALLLALTDAGGEQSEQENDDDGDQRGGTGGKAENDGESYSGESGGGGYGTQAPGKKGKGRRETDGGEQLRNCRLPALEENHA